MSTAYQLPELAYSYHTLEPYIDAQTMELHHTKHHQGYINKLNTALEEQGLPLTLPIADVCKSIDHHTPEAIRNNAGGHYNHTLFWDILSPNANKEPMGSLADALQESFHNVKNFVQQFNQKATTHFGSGWTWLIVNQKGSLEIISTPNQDNPLMPLNPQQGTPILGIDLWEHAYYLKYQNRRADYLKQIWHIIDWQAINQNYENALAKA